MPSSRQSDDQPSEDFATPLFAVPPAEFVAARNQLAGELKKAGKKSEAAAVKALTKPTVTVWAVNQLAREAGKALEKFLEVSDDVWRAQSAGGGDENTRRAYQSSLAAQREALDPLVEKAAAICAEHKVTTNRALLDGIANNLRFGAFDETARGELLSGRLRKDLDPPDFSALVNRIPLSDRPGRAPVAAHAPRPSPAAPARFHARPANDGGGTSSREKGEDKLRAKAERDAEAKQRAQARLQVQEIKSELKPLESQAQRTRAKVASLAQKQERAEAAFEDLRRQLARAETEAGETKAAHARAAAELAKEEGRVAELRAALEEAEAAAKPSA
ncbi:MAG TPA: hypothetical protein VGG33_09845 [Polyangia bacterium]